MRITLQQTPANEDTGKTCCCICEQSFYLGAVTCWASAEGNNTLWGEVCPSCIEGGPPHIQQLLDRKAWWSRLEAMHASEGAEEGISDCPTLDELLAAEAYYVTPRFETGEEYEDALDRGRSPGDTRL